MQRVEKDSEMISAQRFLFLTFELNEKEFLAMFDFEPMTQDIFDSCLEKSVTKNCISVFNQLYEKFPEFGKVYEDRLTEELMGMEEIKRTPEEEEKSWLELCEKIKTKYTN